MANSQPQNRILLLGAGELGTAIIAALTTSPLHSPTRTPLTLLLRPSTLSFPSAQKQTELTSLRQHCTLIGADTETASQAELTSLFKDYDTVIHASGMLASPGVATKITNAVIHAGVGLYFPWQFGVDYDVIGAEGGMGLFEEQFRIRERLRGQQGTKWAVVSCGVFMSFLFEGVWGVVGRVGGGEGEGEDGKVVDGGQGGHKGKIKVTALNSWDDWITVTTAEDIGTCTAKLVLDANEVRNEPVYIAGETLTYRNFANTVERVTGKDVVREVWPLEMLREKASMEPENKLRKYHVVFSEGRGLSWPKERTWNVERGLEMMGVEEWMRKNWK